MIAIVGAGAMGAALAIVHTRAGSRVALLGTKYDDATIEACSSGDPHPALGITLPSSIRFRRSGQWDADLADAERIVLAVSSEGLADVVAECGGARPDAVWLVATKGWDSATLRTPSEVIGHDRVVVLAGPALAPELAMAAPAALVCASRDTDLAASVAKDLDGVSVAVTDDVPGVEIAAAYKNVAAIAVGMCEGLGERQIERVHPHRYANARATLFSQGLRDMTTLAEARGGRPETILGLAGSGDLYVTCLGGRNGAFGRLLGIGETPEQAHAAIGSTVEGVANTRSALRVAERDGVELPVARTVDAVLSGRVPAGAAIADAIHAAAG